MVKVLKWKRRVVDFMAVAKMRILLWEKLLERFVRSQVDYKKLEWMIRNSCGL